MPMFFEVQADDEFERVFGLPRRPIPDPTSTAAAALAAEVTSRLARSKTPWPGPLYPTQALALKEIYESRGAVLPIRTGGGKTLTSALALAVMQPKRPMLLVPAAMIKDTEASWRKLEVHWRIPRFEDVTLLSYEKVSSPSSGAKTLPDGTEIYPDIVRRYNPDMIVMDEAHRFGDISAAGTRRIGRYLADNPEVVVVAMSGTLIRRTVKDAAHIFEWALGDRAPLPVQWESLQAWADATDPRQTKGKRTGAGALLQQLSASESAAYDEAASQEDAAGVVCGMLGRRILETPGVVGSADGPLNIPAVLRPYYVADEDEAIEEEYVRLLEGDEDSGRAAWTLPDGTVLPDAIALARPLNTLSFGFVLVQDPAPPEDYRLAASAWGKAVRDTVKYRHWLNLDSEWQVRDAVDRGVIPEFAELLAAWRGASAHYTATTGLREPPSKPIWVSDEVIGEVARWLKGGPGVVWVSWRALGERLSKELGLPYFAGGKVDAKGRHVTKLKKGESALLSLASVGTGSDGIQRCHYRALWMCAPSEQPLARLHRPGFEWDRVENDIYLGSGSCLARFWRQVSLAENFAGRLSGSAMKLSYFENEMPRTMGMDGRRWTTVAGSETTGEDA